MTKATTTATATGMDRLLLPKETDFSKAFQAGHVHVLQQLMSQVLEYVVGTTTTTTKDDKDHLHDHHHVESRNLIVNTLRKEQEQEQVMMDIDEIDPKSTTTSTKTSTNSTSTSTSNIASDSFVDALWLQTSFMDQPASCTVLVKFVQSVLTELYSNSNSNTSRTTTTSGDDINTVNHQSGENNNNNVKKKDDDDYHNNNNNNSSISSHKEYLYTRLLESCDATFLQSITIISSSTDLQKKLRLTNTAVNYRQHKFNLLAEESEGYSKLLYYLLLSIPPPPPTSNGNSEKVELLILKPNIEKQNEIRSALGSLICTYSLDPNRCLDLTIDVIESELIYLHQQQKSMSTNTASLNDESKSTISLSFFPVYTPRLQFLMDCIRTCSVTHKLPQLLGFKLKGRLEKRIDHETQKTNHIVPISISERNVHSLLYCMVWIDSYSVIDDEKKNTQRQSLLNIVDVIQYVPDNENGTTYNTVVETTFQQIYEIEKERIVNVGRVRLSSGGGGGVGNDTTSGIDKNNTKDTINSDNNNKNTNIVHSPTAHIMKPLLDQITIQYIHVYLLLFPKNGWDHLRAIQIFKNQWSELSYLFPSTVGCAICDWVHQRVLGWFHNIVPFKDSSNNDHNDDNDAHNKEPIVMMEEDIEITTVTNSTNTNTNTNNGQETISIDHILDTIIDPLMYTWESGCIALRPVLYSQICRLLVVSLIQQNNVTYDGDVVKNPKLIGFLRDYLLPSLSLFLSNSVLSLEIWNVLKLLPYRTRYILYCSWKGNGLERNSLTNIDKPLWLIEGELQIGKDVRYSLKRLSKDTIREMSRAVAKCCHSHPLVVFTTILNQIESYDNLVQVMVDSFRFVTPLSLDVLGFSILQRLIGTSGGTSRSRLKENGVNSSQWLQSLESFTGAFYKRFPFVEFQSILCYLIQRIKNGQVMELGMLRTLLTTSSGWGFADYSPAASLSAYQLEGRAGSTTLKRETMFFGIVEDISLHSSNEIRRALQIDNIGVTLLILLAQVKHKIVFEKPTNGRPKPVKLIGNLFDTCQVVMTVLLDFLTTTMDAKDETNVQRGLLQYSNSLPSLNDLLDVYKMDVASAWMLCRPLIRFTASTLTDSAPPTLDDSSITLVQSKFRLDEASRKIYKSNLYSEETWTHLTTDLFEQFYTATLYDLFCPEDIYHSEISRLEKDIERISRHKPATLQQMSVQPGPVSDKNDKDEIERMKKVSEQLTSDLLSHKKHVKTFRDRLNDECKKFFSFSDISVSKSAMTFFHRCVYPRCLQSPDEALFCARFVQALHEKDAPGFGTLHFLDALLVILSRSLFCLTEGEAACASILLSETWKVVSKWRYDDQAFEQELVGKPGSFMEIVSLAENSQSTEAAVTAEAYKNLYNKWHAAIGSTCVGCLQSSEYMHLRNCLVVLTRMVDCYPTRPRLANKLLDCLEPLQDESNPFADIRASAQAYSMQLLKARDDGVWKEEDAATVQARIEREQAAAEKRYRKAEEQMAEIKRDQEKITEEIGDSRDRDRSGRIRGGNLSSSVGIGLGGGNKSFEPTGRGGRSGGGDINEQRRELEDRRTIGGIGDDRRRIMEDRQRGLQQQPSLAPQITSDRWSRDNRGGTSSGSYAAIGSTLTSSVGVVRRGEDIPAPSGRGLEGRWQRANENREQQKQVSTSIREGSKRSRPSSPTEQGETREDGIHPPAQKRARAPQDSLDELPRQEDASNRIRSRPSVQRRRHVARR